MYLFLCLQILFTYLLCIFSQDEGTPQFTAVVTITVNVTNEIEQAPVFTQKLYYTTLAEGTYSVMVSCLGFEINLTTDI